MTYELINMAAANTSETKMLTVAARFGFSEFMAISNKFVLRLDVQSSFGHNSCQ
jgi:hypothetical protein